MINTIDKNLILIDDGGKAVVAGNQKWFSKFSHSISGCGPTTASLILMYMASAFPDKCRKVYPYELPAHRNDFVAFMASVRKFVKPGFQGLTDVRFFASSTVAFAKSMDVGVASNLVSSSLPVGVAYGYIKKAVDEGYLPALLILRNPEKELDDFTWHWMAVTGYDDEKRTVIIATNGEEHELSIDKVWCQKRPYKSACVYFYPE